MKRLWLSWVIALVVILAACGDDKKEEDKTTPPEKIEEENKDDENNEDEVEEDEIVEEDEEVSAPAISNGEFDFDAIVKEMEEITEGETKLIFENLDPLEHDMEGVKITLDGYRLMELNDFHTDYSIPFSHSTDGAVILAHYTIENTLDKTIRYSPQFDVTYPGAVSKNNYRDLISRDLQLNTKLGIDNEFRISAGETVTGYVVNPLGPEMYEDIMKLGEIDIEINRAADYDAETDDYNPPIGKDSKFTVSVSEEGAANIADRDQFYNDMVTNQSMGTKTMIKEKIGINETAELSKSNITLEGYQFTEFEPSEYEASRFSGFDEGIVLLTVNYIIENNEEEPIGLSNLGSSKMDFNNGKMWTLSEGMLTEYRYGDVIEPGESAEYLTVFILDKEQYDLIWKDKKFEVQFGPLMNDESRDISKGKDLTFELPQ